MPALVLARGRSKTRNAFGVGCIYRKIWLLRDRRPGEDPNAEREHGVLRLAMDDEEFYKTRDEHQLQAHTVCRNRDVFGRADNLEYNDAAAARRIGAAAAP
eukprot:364655-Pleurochrysis_carterae.AAC.2